MSQLFTNMKIVLELLFAALFTAALFTNCQHNPASNTAQSANDSTATDASKAKGAWVNKAWLETLQSTKSPRKAAEKLGIAGVNILQDSAGNWVAEMNYAFHEGGLYQLLPVEGGNFHLVVPEGGEKLHEFIFKTDGKVFLDSFEMVRFGEGDLSPADIGNLVTGTYSLKGKTGDVTFQPDGSLTGMEGYNKFEIQFDYVVDEVGADELMLIKPDDVRDFFVFEIKGNQLLLYVVDEIKDKDGASTYKKGKVFYELTRK